MIFISIIVFVIATIVCIQWFIGIRKIPILNQITGNTLTKTTSTVSMIVAARNEEKHIYEAVSTMLDQVYPHVEVIVVDDRSEDDTFRLLNELKATHKNRKRLRIVQVTSLPNGWLGKNHALYQGYLASKSDYLLFTDADITFHHRTLQKVMAYTDNMNIDHLALIPQNLKGTLFYRGFLSYWSILGVWNFIQLRHAGVGAFNLINRRVYEDIGTHIEVAMAPDDDLKLGKQVVKKGYRQQLGFGNGLVFVQWYENIPQVINGLEKNLFAFMRYNLGLAGFFSIAIILLHTSPFIAIFYTEGFTQLFLLAALLIYLFMYVFNQPYSNDSWLFFLLMPINGILFTYCLLRSAYKTLRQGGVKWRGTTYSMKDLRK
ncbi:glycosyltransferase [Paenalkalicoccus suaedae]|uniref:4,4'-diaponeurosporenoate glycosyltransferase n=1 Tax=Paenalkalicoccus suaedae TaxID=2592382 RepID=A0A859FCN5_9BACI|nr:glycosyltransferase family 2 protein [Paenalkalicoccus suaedae]QKS70551.1 glycosyltransferase [Paenalkalicoccus suaedae]